MNDLKKDELGAPKIVDRSTFQMELDSLRIREKAHTHEGDAIAAARRRLPMVEVDPTITLSGPRGPVTLLDTFEVVDSSLPTTLCGTPGILRRSSAKGARGSLRRSTNCPTFIPAMSPSPCFARDRTKRVRGIGTSWAGTYPGTQRKAVPSMFCLAAAVWAGCTSFATCERDPTSSRLIGRRRGVSR